MDENDRSWFWTPEWQAGEREADDDISNGRTERFDDAEALLESLDGRERMPDNDIPG